MEPLTVELGCVEKIYVHIIASGKTLELLSLWKTMKRNPVRLDQMIGRFRAKNGPSFLQKNKTEGLIFLALCFTSCFY